MVRGRKKCVKLRIKSEAGSLEDLSYDAPKTKDSKLSKEFKGKLSHASPQFNNVRITNFFVPVGTLTIKKEEIQDNNAVPIIGRTSPRKNPLLQPFSGWNSDELEEKNGMGTPHKIQLQAEELPLSPSSALSQLHISATPKKAAKCKRRLNPSQSTNQQAVPRPPAWCKLAANVPSPNHKLTEYFPVRRSERKTKRTVLEERQKGLEESVLTQKEVGLEVHNFEGKGRGVVATHSFCKGEFVVEYAGELIDMGLAKEREKNYAQDQNTGCYMYYFKHRNHQYCVDATAESGRLGRLVNHSRNGNLITKTVVIENQPRLVLIAKEDIRPGEEVMYDYGDRSKESLRYHPWLSS